VDTELTEVPDPLLASVEKYAPHGAAGHTNDVVIWFRASHKNPDVVSGHCAANGEVWLTAE
jgi:hypothetical protein